MSARPEVSGVTTFGTSGIGTRMSSFDHDGIRVSVQPVLHEDNEKAFDLACALSRAWSTIFDLRAKIADQATVIELMRAKMPSHPPARLLGRGCVRFRDGHLYLLNKREGGWAEFAVACVSWDDLFRRYNVAVVEHGSDEFGPWWEVENAKGGR